MKTKTEARADRLGQAAVRSDNKVTLEMVAQATGVSPSTMSRILNGTAVVADEKRAAVVTGRNLKAPGRYALNFDNFKGARLATQNLLN